VWNCTPTRFTDQAQAPSIHRGSDPETLAREAVERFVEYDEWFAGEVEKGLASIESGATLSHEEVGVRLEALLEKRSRR
jgi:predicted transcriptional regulator